MKQKVLERTVQHTLAFKNSHAHIYVHNVLRTLLIVLNLLLKIPSVSFHIHDQKIDKNRIKNMQHERHYVKIL